MGSETILVVEDHADIQLTVRLTLEMWGYNVMAASDSQQAFEALAKCTPDLILLDLSLPGLSGWQLLEKIRSIRGLDETPVVVTTAHVGPEISRRAVELGASDYLPKPYEANVLNETIRRLLAEGKKQ